MRDISELIYETCKTYLITQGKFLIVLWLFIAVVIVLYFGVLAPVPGKSIAVDAAHHSSVQFDRHRRKTTGSLGSAFASIPLLIRVLLSPVCAASLIRSTTRRWKLA